MGCTWNVGSFILVLSHKLNLMRLKHEPQFVLINIKNTPTHLNSSAPFAIDNWLTAAWLAQLVGRQSAVREVEGSSPRSDQHSGS